MIRPEWAQAVRELVDAAPPLTPEQVDKLAALINAAPSKPSTEATRRRAS